MINKWNDLDKNTKLLIVAMLSIVLLVLAILSIINYDIPRKILGNPVISTTNTNIIGQVDLSDETDLELLDSLLYIINNEESGLYTIKNRNFIVLTSGGMSSFDIDYDISGMTDGSMLVQYRISDIADNEFKLRYKIIEVDNTNVIVENKVNNIESDGYTFIIISGNSDSKTVIDVIKSKQITNMIDVVQLNGLYTAIINNGIITEANRLDSVVTSKCKLISKINESMNTFNMQFEDGSIIEVKSLDLNPLLDRNYLFKITYIDGVITCQIVGGEPIDTSEIGGDLIESEWVD